MTELIEFLRARLDERKATARAATPGPWEAEVHYHRRTQAPCGFEVHPVAEQEGNGDGGVTTEADARHIAAHDPARVLAEVEAMRKIVDLHRVIGGWEDEDGHDRGLGCEHCGHSEEYSECGGWCETLRLLTLPYADHPDYRPEWRP